MIEIALVIIISYLVGAIPNAYLVGKLFYKKDLRQEGTGNIGAMNTFDVTGSKLAGVAVFILDFAKGMLAIWLISLIFESDFYYIRLAGIFAVIGHNYNIFIGFKGGRGLSTAAGVLTMINPLPILMWGIMYFTTKKVIQDNVHVGILGGCIGSLVLLIGVPKEGLEIFAQTSNFEILSFKIFYAVLGLVIVSKLAKPLRELFGSDK